MFSASLKNMGLSDMTVELKQRSFATYAGGGNTVYAVPSDLPYRASKNALYGLLSTLTGEEKAWGAITGVKPVKLYAMCVEAGLSDPEAYYMLHRYFAISSSKFELISKCFKNQFDKLYAPSATFSLYVHIPLCVSKCSYCSFPSEICAEGSDVCEKYTEAAVKELEALKRFAREYCIECNGVYVGGGTPGILSAAQTEKLLSAIGEIAPKGAEFTFEAGRCDALTDEKLKILKAGGVNRLCVNPQTTNDETLKRINRPCSTKMFLDAYGRARKYDFDVINCDIIFGLEGESYADFTKSLNDVIALDPENITLHSLCKKRTSETEAQNIENSGLKLCDYHDRAREALAEHGYEPYYAYRQQRAIDNAENTGYARDKKTCAYNIRMMGEKQTILSAGASSTTKLYDEASDTFRSVYNLKNTSLYINGIDKVIEKKLSSMKNLTVTPKVKNI